MKNNQEIKQDPFAEAKAHISATHSLMAAQHARKQFPKTMDEYAGSVILPLQSQVQELIDQNGKLYLPGKALGHAMLAEKNANAELALIQPEIDQLNIKRAQLIAKAESVKPDVAHLRFLKWTGHGIVAVAVSEGYFSFTGIRHATPFDVALIGGIGIGLVTGFGAHKLASWIRKARTKRQYWRRYACSIAPYAVGFSLLGMLRASAYAHVPDYYGTQAADQSTFNYVAIPFALISLAMFWLTLSLSIQYYKTKVQARNEQNYKDALSEIKSIDERIAGLEEKKQLIRREADVIRMNSAATYETAANAEAELISFAYSTAYSYNNINYSYRTGEAYPSFFATPPQFKFKTFFDNLKKKINEKD